MSEGGFFDRMTDYRLIEFIKCAVVFLVTMPMTVLIHEASHVIFITMFGGTVYRVDLGLTSGRVIFSFYEPGSMLLQLAMVGFVGNGSMVLFFLLLSKYVKPLKIIALSHIPYAAWESWASTCMTIDSQLYAAQILLPVFGVQLLIVMTLSVCYIFGIIDLGDRK